MNSTEFWLLYRAQGLRIGLWENWLLFTAGQLGNLLPGQVGTLYRFRYLKVVHRFSYGRSGSAFGANLVLTFASSAVAGIVGLVGVAATGGTVRPWIVAAVVGLAVVSIAVIAVPVPAVPVLTGPADRAWRGFRSGWNDLRRQPGVAGLVLALDLSKYLLVAWRFQISFALLGVDEPYWYFLVIAPAAGLAGLLSFTPGGLGFREAFVTAAAVGMGSEFDIGLLAATVDRGVMLAASVVLGSVGFAVTLPKLRRAGGGLPRRSAELRHLSSCAIRSLVRAADARSCGSVRARRSRTSSRRSHSSEAHAPSRSGVTASSSMQNSESPAASMSPAALCS